MPHVITSLCMRDGGCATVCPVECIVPGKPTEQWPWFYVDADTCIDCGACEPECPFSAIMPIDDCPTAYTAKGGERLSMPAGTPGFTEPFDRLDHNGDAVQFPATRQMEPGEVVDLTPAIEINAAYFNEGPGYSAAR